MGKKRVNACLKHFFRKEFIRFLSVFSHLRYQRKLSVAICWSFTPETYKQGKSDIWPVLAGSCQSHLWYIISIFKLASRDGYRVPPHHFPQLFCKVKTLSQDPDLSIGSAMKRLSDTNSPVFRLSSNIIIIAIHM